ncbi:MAG: acetyl-CoA C-acetyltransferase [Desulfobacterales bacterium]|nr:MAG: acetyl-CoA C-acetyltransferase [Desulfobacterales bacterium]
MRDAYIFDAVRTPRGLGKTKGSLYEVSPIELLMTVFKSLKERNHLDTSHVEDVVLGCVTPVGEQGANIARIAALYAGWDVKVAGVTLNRFCASGLEACHLCAAKIMAGIEDLVVAGGVESMSRVPMGSDGGAWYQDPKVNNAISFIPQGVAADLIATLEGFTREDVDRFALISHQKAAHATREGYFNKSMIPVKDMNGIVILDHDELIRDDASLAAMADLNPSFAVPGQMGFDDTALRKYPWLEKINHVHHAGNSSGIVDGAALFLIGSKEKGRMLGLKPRAKFKSMAVIGEEPTIMLTGPIPATKKALKKANMTINDIDLFEINEAFSSVVLKTMQDLGVDPDKVNVNGGAIAMGHPLGITGGMLLNTLLDELERRDKQTGLCTLCVGGGMGIATIIERV